MSSFDWEVDHARQDVRYAAEVLGRAEHRLAMLVEANRPRQTQAEKDRAAADKASWDMWLARGLTPSRSHEPRRIGEPAVPRDLALLLSRLVHMHGKVVITRERFGPDEKGAFFDEIPGWATKVRIGKERNPESYCSSSMTEWAEVDMLRGDTDLLAESLVLALQTLARDALR